AEDGGVRANADRKSGHGNNGESRRLSQLAKSEAEISHGNLRFSNCDFRLDFSFSTERDHGVDLGGAPRRDETGDQGNSAEDERRAEKSGEMKRGHAEEHALHRPSSEPGADQPENRPGDEKTQA